MKLTTSREKTLRNNWQKIVVIRIHENGDEKRISTEDIKEPKLKKVFCKIARFFCKLHCVLLKKENTI